MEQAFLQHIQTNQKIIYKVCHLYRDTKEDQEDLFQEIVYQLWKAYPGFKGEAKPGTWIYRVALNTALAAYRKQRLSVSYPDQLPEMEAYTSEVNSSEKEDLLFRALRILSDSEKVVISLYLEDFSYEEIAAITGLSENNVGVRLNRIKNKLKEHLK